MLVGAAAGHTSQHKIHVDGLERTFLLRLPAAQSTTAAATAQPLVLNFHGWGTTARAQEQGSGMSAFADTAGFVSAYLQGSDDMNPVANAQRLASGWGCALLLHFLSSIPIRTPV
jgi:poly(3-hydroxybutyrate) depolymerase